MIAREFIKARLIETLTSPTGAGSNLNDPQHTNHAGEPHIEIDRGIGGTIDVEHLTSDVENIIDELKARDLHE